MDLLTNISHTASMFDINNIYNTRELKRFYLPTKILIGQNARNILFEILPQQSKGVSLLIVVDHYFKQDNFIKNILDYKFASLVCKVVVEREPDYSFINKQIKSLPKKVDYIIAVGGGSTIDTAKAILAHKKYGTSRQIGYGSNRFIKELPVKQAPVFIALPTTAGSGSEVSRYYLIFDEKSKKKIVNRSWSVCPSFTILDPYFLNKASVKLLIYGSFDAFVHLWETYICRYERSAINDMFALEGITIILSIIPSLFVKTKLSVDQLLKLQYCAMLGGIALSNTRTGIIHDAGEALSAQTSLSHPETLFIFFENAIRQYYGKIRGKESLLISRLNSISKCADIATVKDIILLWKKLFKQHGLEEQIRNKTKMNKINIRDIVDQIMSDKVLINKESPVKLNRDKVVNLVKRSLQDYT